MSLARPRCYYTTTTAAIAGNANPIGTAIDESNLKPIYQGSLLHNLGCTGGQNMGYVFEDAQEQVWIGVLGLCKWGVS